MTLEQDQPKVITDLNEKRRKILATTFAGGILTAFPVSGAIIGYELLHQENTRINAQEVEVAVAAERCAAFVLSKTIATDERLTIKASELTKQQREDCNAPEPDTEVSRPYQFEGSIIYTDYTLEFPSAETLETVAVKKRADSKTESIPNLALGIGAGALGGIAIPLFAVAGVGAIQNNRRRNNGKFSYKDTARRLRKNAADTLMLLGR